MRHEWATLSAENRAALYVPEGVYHGFLTLEDDSEVFYQMSEFFVPGTLLGVRWNDPAIGIEWDEQYCRAAANRVEATSRLLN